MISYLYGEGWQETGENLLILDVNGIGYEINTTAAACELLGGTAGEGETAHIHAGERGRDLPFRVSHPG